MPYFEGRDFSLIHDTLPPDAWGKEHFFSDWRQQMVQAETLFNSDDLNMAEAIVLTSFYSTYQECRNMIQDAQKLSPDQRQKFMQKLNMAMTNLLEFGQRSNKDITKSLLDRKIRKDEDGTSIFNDIIDLLIQELQHANLAFHKKQEEFYKKKREAASKI